MKQVLMLLESCFGKLINPFKHIFEMSLFQGALTEKTKTEKITLILKTNEATFVDNYGPISLLPCFSKTLGR